jgi:hypothetical protein
MFFSLWQTFIDIMIFGSIIYWMVGLAPSGHLFFIYIAILFIFSLVMNQTLSIFAAISKTKTGVQGAGSCVLLMLILTCGFIGKMHCFGKLMAHCWTQIGLSRSFLSYSR